MSEDAYILYIPLKLNVLLIGSFHTEMPFDEMHAYMLETGIPDGRVAFGIIIILGNHITDIRDGGHRSIILRESKWSGVPNFGQDFITLPRVRFIIRLKDLKTTGKFYHAMVVQTISSNL